MASRILRHRISGVCAGVLAFALLVPPLSAPAFAVDAPVADQRPSTRVRALEPRAPVRQPAGEVRALADSDSDIPGAVPLVGASGSLKGWLDARTDSDDVYKVTLADGDVLLASISGPVGTQFDLWLYPPTATGIYTSSPVWYSNAADVKFKYPIEIELGVDLPLKMAAYGKNRGDIFPAGTYYLDAWAGVGGGYYTLTWQIVHPVDIDPANADIPGAIPLRPQTEWISDLWDSDDVFQVELDEGDQLDVTITSSDRNLVADAFLYRPTAASVMTDYFTAWSPIQGDVYPATFSYVVPKGGAGTYSVDCYAIAWSGTYTFTYSVTPDPRVVRLAGQTRYDTAQTITRSCFAEATTAVLATGANFADALSAAGLAGVYDAPLLLVGRDTLPDAVAWELLSLGVQKVFIVGGPNAVSVSVERTLNGSYQWFGGYLSLSVERIAGPDRYATMARVAERVVERTGSHSAFLVRGDAFADALAVAPLAYTQGMPVLLTPPHVFDGYARGFIESRDTTTVYIAGGTSAVSTAVERAVAGLNGGTTAVWREAGRDRYETAARVAALAKRKGWNDFGFVAVATGTNFPDALAGGVGAGKWGGVLLLTNPRRLSGEVEWALRANADDHPKVAVLGGPNAVSAPVYSRIQSVLK